MGHPFSQNTAFTFGLGPNRGGGDQQLICSVERLTTQAPAYCSLHAFEYELQVCKSNATFGIVLVAVSYLFMPVWV